MRKFSFYSVLVLILLTFKSLIAQIQPPCCGPPPGSNSGISYQTVVRDLKGNPIRNSKVSLEIGIGPLGNFVYEETFSDTTNEFGIVNLTIGSGTAVWGNYLSIDWSQTYYITTFIDITGGTNYVKLGTSILNAVPYSLYSVRSGLLTMTSAHRDSLTNVFQGMQILNTTTGCLNYYNGKIWQEICGNCVPQPSKAIAGSVAPTIYGDSVTLAANTPTSGVGTWTITQGTGGSFTDKNNPATVFKGVSGNTYKLRWTISTPCGSSYDSVTVTLIACGGKITDSRDGRQYNTVLIGTQCWMAQNLNVGTMITGTTAMSDNGIIERYCYSNDTNNCVTYGAFYQWNEMMQYVTTESAQGICPNGWHLPSDAEWYTLGHYLDPTINDPNATGWIGTVAGTKLVQGGSSGFNVLMSGWRLLNGNFFLITSATNFWTTTQSAGSVWYRQLSPGDAQIARSAVDKGYGNSVRCLKN